MHLPQRLLAAVAALLAWPAVASAVVTSSAIDVPPGGTLTHVHGNQGDAAATITGTATAAIDPDSVELRCYPTPSPSTFTTPGAAGLVTGGQWSVAFDASAGGGFPDGPCVLRAVPPGYPGNGPLGAFAPARYMPQIDARFMNGALLADYERGAGGAAGWGTFESMSTCGLCMHVLRDEDGYRSAPTWRGAAALWPNDDGPERELSQIDGRNVYGAGSARDIGAPGAPGLTFASTIRADGLLTLDEGQDLVRCANTAAPVNPNAGECGTFVPAGVRLERHVEQAEGGTLWRITDRWRSTDGQPHRIDVRYAEYYDPSPPEWSLPWADGAGYASRTDTGVAGPGGLAATIYARAQGAPDGDFALPQSAIVAGPAPDRVSWRTDPALARLEWVREVPAGGEVVIAQHLVTGRSRAALGDLAAREERSIGDLLRPPAPPAAGTPVPAVPSGTQRDVAAPVVTGFGLTRARFRAGTRPTPLVASAAARTPTGTSFRYRLSEAATVTIAIARRTTGARSGARCVKRTRRNRSARRCTRLEVRGTLRRTSRAGANTVAFTGRIGRTRLTAGSYRATLVATDPAGNRSRPRSAALTVTHR